MTRPFICLFALLLCTTGAEAAPTCPPLLQHQLPRLQDERPVDLCQFAGRVVLVVNTASQCGYTPQYRSLEALYSRYRDRGLVVLGFPSNDFGGQEPGGNTSIAEFCENQFAVRFPMFAKSSVRSLHEKGSNPLYVALAQRSGQSPRWNFHKYLIARDGASVRSYASDLAPDAPALIADIERLLNAR